MDFGGLNVFGGITGLSTAINNFLAASDAAAARSAIGAAGTALLNAKQNTIQIAVIQDKKTAGVSGGSFTGGADRTRDLNTVVQAQSWLSLSSNQFTLDAGTYLIEGWAPAVNVNRHQAVIRNVTDSTEVRGQSAFTTAGNGAQVNAIVQQYVTLAASKTFELRHYGQTNAAANGFGVALNIGNPEVYSQVRITRYA